MWSTRSSRALVGAALLSILTVLPASAGLGPQPDRVTGTVAPVTTVDQADLTGVACGYTPGALPQLTGVRVGPPDIRWPDRRPAVSTEHGRVTWQVIVQRSPVLQDGPWTQVARSAVRRGTATEASGPTLKGVTLTLDPVRSTWIRVIHKVTWVRPNGRMLGSLRRTHANYAWLQNGQEVAITIFLCPMVFDEG